MNKNVAIAFAPLLLWLIVFAVDAEPFSYESYKIGGMALVIWLSLLSCIYVGGRLKIVPIVAAILAGLSILAYYALSLVFL